MGDHKQIYASGKCKLFVSLLPCNVCGRVLVIILLSESVNISAASLNISFCFDKRIIVPAVKLFVKSACAPVRVMSLGLFILVASKPLLEVQVAVLLIPFASM